MVSLLFFSAQMKNIITRTATEAEAGLIAEMSRETFYETFSPHNSKANMEKFMKEQFTREALIGEVLDKSNIFFLAFSGNDPVGYAKMRKGEKPPAYERHSCIEIARIYAMRSFIGKGVGNALMEKCIQTAVERKNEILWLGVWEKNQGAIDFYLRWGFKKFGTQVFLLGDDLQTDWLMSILLPVTG